MNNEILKLQNLLNFDYTCDFRQLFNENEYLKDNFSSIKAIKLNHSLNDFSLQEKIISNNDIIEFSLENKINKIKGMINEINNHYHILKDEIETINLSEFDDDDKSIIEMIIKSSKGYLINELKILDNLNQISISLNQIIKLIDIQDNILKEMQERIPDNE